MAKIFAGTAFNQLISFNTTIKGKKHHTIYGPMCKNTVHSITYNKQDDNIFYATNKTIRITFYDGSSNQLLKIKGQQSIINILYDQQAACLRYCLSNGAIKGISSKMQKFSNVYSQITLFKGEDNNKYSGCCWNSTRQKCLFYGKGILPLIANVRMGVVQWKGKNVKHDELDLQVPINDVDAQFLQDDKFISILNADNKLRIYDVRGTQRRPIKDIALKTNQKIKLTKMKLSLCKQYYFIANDIGQIYQFDSKKDFQLIAKFKGIATSITALVVSNELLIVSSLDSNVRVFDIQSKLLKGKYYMNKLIYSLYADFIQTIEVDIKQQEINVEEQQEQQVSRPKIQKIKQIRKRNKVGLKYLQPRQFDDPQPQVKQQAIPEKWYQKLNAIDRRQFQGQQ